MRVLRSLLFRLHPLFRRRKIEDGLAEEIQSHLEFATEAYVAKGLSPAEARRTAEREFGGVEQIKESWRDQRGLPGLDQLQQDLRAAFRSLRKTRGFTFVAILSLGVAIGANTTAFSLFNGFLLRPLAPRDDASVVSMFVGETGDRPNYRPFSYAEYVALRSARQTFAEVAATFRTFTAVTEPDGQLRRGGAFFTSENYFSLLGVVPQLGRFFTAEECRPNANARVMVVSDAFWRRLGSRADVIGSTVRANGLSYTIVGVAPREFDGYNALIATDWWLPLGVMATFGGDPHNLGSDEPSLLLTARLAPQLTVKSAASHLPALVGLLHSSAHPVKLQITRPSRFNVSAWPSTREPIAIIVSSFLPLAGSVLLIAGFNLGNMLLARGTDRAREIALRTALGATRFRIIRQLLTEGLLLGFAGGVLGLIIALAASHSLRDGVVQLNSTMYRSSLQLPLDARVFAVTAVCCVFVTLLFSFLPALKASRVDLVSDLKQQGGESASAHRLGRFFAWRHVVLMLQVAVSLAVIFAAVLFIRGAIAAGRTELGFDPRNGLVAEFDFSLHKTSFAEVQREVLGAIERARAQPGAIAAGVATFLPYGNTGASKQLEVPRASSAVAVTGGAVIAEYAAVTSGYLEALGVPLLRGRDFTSAEAGDPDGRRIAIIDEWLAQRLFPGGDALGRHVKEFVESHEGTKAMSPAPEYEIVGICAMHLHELADGPQGSLYVPFAAARDHRGSTFLQVRYDPRDSTEISASVGDLRKTLLAGDHDLPLINVAPFATLIDLHGTLWIARTSAVLLSTFGATALLLAVVGLYGVKSYAVARRTREIGIRMALGASPRAAFNLILRQALLQIALALTVGTLLALGLGKVVGSIVYKVGGSDPVALLVAALVLALAGVAACWVPARRATKVDPILALRCE